MDVVTLGQANKRRAKRSSGIMLGNLKSHIVNISVMLLMWICFVSVIAILALFGHAIVMVVQTLGGSLWSYFWIALAIIFIPPIVPWAIWLRKYPS